MAACAPGSEGGEGGANANDRTDGEASEGDRLESGAMAISPNGAYIVARRNATTLIVDVKGEKVTELPLVGERFAFSKTRDVVYAVLANLEGVVAIDLATTTELWRKVPAFLTGTGAYLARVTDDDTTLVVADYDRLFFIDPKDGNIRTTAKVGARPVDLELLPGQTRALVVAATAWVNGGPHTPVSLVGIADASVTTIDVPNCAAPVSILTDGTRALLSPTFCTPDAELQKQGWKNPDPVSVIDLDATAGTLTFVRNLPGFGPVALSADGRAVAYLDTKRIDPAMFDDKSQIPSSTGPQYHLMTIDPKTMKFDLSAIGAALPRFAPSRDGKSLLVDASVTVVRTEATASITLDSSGTIRAELKGAFDDTSGSLFGAFDLATKKYAPFVGPAAALDRFVQLGDGSRVFTLKATARGGDLFAIDVAARTSVAMDKNLRDIGILPDGVTLVLRARMSATAEGHVREEFCFSTDARACSSSIIYTSPTPQRD
jgi:hypothetical protein